jgi:hypothetical protein
MYLLLFCLIILALWGGAYTVAALLTLCLFVWWIGWAVVMTIGAASDSGHHRSSYTPRVDPCELQRRRYGRRIG